MLFCRLSSRVRIFSIVRRCASSDPSALHLPQALLQQLERTLHAPVLEGYGMTEAGAITSNALPPHGRKPGSVGQSTGSEIGIMSEAGQLLPPDCDGEIVVRGAAVMQSYRNNPEANRSAFRERLVPDRRSGASRTRKVFCS